MRRRAVVALAGALACLLGTGDLRGRFADAVEPPARSLAARAHRFPPVTSSRAVFEQERQVSLVDEVLRASGLIEFRAPDHMRLDLAAPETMTIIVDGGTLTVLDAKGAAVAVPAEFSGFARFGHVLTDLMLAGKGPERFREEWQGADAVTLRPDDEAAPFSEIALRFQPDGPFATEVVLRERGGDQTTIRLRPLPATSPSLPPRTAS